MPSARRLACLALSFTCSLMPQSPAAQSTSSEVPAAPISQLPYSPSLDLTSMDRSVDPCTDFYHYSCGNWIKKNPIPPDEASWQVYGKLHYENQLFLWGILTEAAKSTPSRGRVEQQIGDYFHACMDEAAIENAGLAPLDPELRAIEAVTSLHDLTELVAKEHLNRDDALFEFGSGQDFEDSNQVIAFAASGGLGLPDRDYYVQDDPKMREIREKYLAHMGRMFELLGDDPKNAASEAQTVMTIETALAKASLTRVEKRDPYNLFHKMTLAQLQTLAPSLAWNAYLRASGAVGITTVNVTEPGFYKEVDRQLTGQPLANWKTYLRWHLASSSAPYLFSKFVNENFAFYGKTLQGIEILAPRWKRCVEYVDRDLGEALGQVFVAKTFGPERKAKTLEMTRQIENAMAGEIKSLPWMGDETKQQALLKLHTVV